MQIIPVLDLMQGCVVHAVKGRRERYRPVQSILTASPDPLDVARCLQAETKCRALYIADLDAIQEKGDNSKVIDQIASKLDVELWVDAGVTDTESADRLLSGGADVAIVGSETLPTLHQLQQIYNSIVPEKIIFSLDVTDGLVISRAKSLKKIDPLSALKRLSRENIKRFILLTLDAVGSGEGPDLPLLKRAKHAFPNHTFIAGGGVKKPEHLNALSAAEITGVLVATSLHRGWIRGPDIAALV